MIASRNKLEDAVVNKRKSPTTCLYQSKFFSEIAEEDPIVLIDIGARGGISRKWEPLRGAIRAIGFEPDEDECRQLNETSGDDCLYLPVALSNKKGKVNLNITRKLACCSIFEPNYALVKRFWGSEDYDVTSTAEIDCDTLDEVVKTTAVEDVDFIKIDTQGSELQILQGAEDTLDRLCVFGLEIEVEFSPLYKDQPLFADVDAFLRDKGFALFDLRTPPGRKIRKTLPEERKDVMGQGLWTYGLYFRDFASEKSSCLERLSRKKAVKTIAIAEFRGFNDFALELLDFYRSQGIIQEPEYSDISNMLLTGKVTAKARLGPERKLYLNLRRSAGEFLDDRFPFIYKLLVKNRGLK